MSLSTYADLQTQVANWLARSDLTSFIPDMITLFEAAAARRLRVRAMEVTANATTVSGVAALPSNFLEMRRLTWTGTPQTDLNYVHPSNFVFFDPNATTVASAPPQIYTLESGNIKVDPIDDSSQLQMVYYAKTGALSSALNWLYTNHPDVYLFGTLAEANAFNKDVDKAGLWKARRDEIFDEIQMQEFRERGGLSIAVKGATP